MIRGHLQVKAILFSFLVGIMTMVSSAMAETIQSTAQIIDLPPAMKHGGIELNDALLKRRSHREFTGKQLTLKDLSQLVWSAQGITRARGLRTAPSAGALYPLELYVVTNRVEGLAAGIYHYRVKTHQLQLITSGDYHQRLAQAAMGQDVIEQAAAVIAITAVYARTEIKYGARAKRYVHIEVGHVAQNIYLQATGLGLGTVMVGAFDDTRVKKVLGLENDYAPLALLPIGHLP
jgi:SagB-type dehydrogenase family enzyme